MVKMLSPWLTMVASFLETPHTHTHIYIYIYIYIQTTLAQPIVGLIPGFFIVKQKANPFWVDSLT